MKINSFYLLIAIFAACIFSCSDDDSSTSLPIVTTASPLNVTTTSATVGGKIESNGNDAITRSGVVYSSNVAEPTIADNKMESTASSGDFSVNLSGLSSGTTYHVRAFATNSIGTSYGDVKNFVTGNSAPTVAEVTITGPLEVNKSVTLTYKYVDAEGDAEAGTTFQWYSADSNTGTGEAIIPGATAKSFLITEGLNGRFLRVSIVPKAGAGTVDGTEVKSSYTTAIGAETVTFDYNGASVTYGTIISVKSNRTWLDRNLGASRVAESVGDYMAIGDMFQWGRPADGHQRVDRSNGTDAGASGPTGTTSTTSDIDAPSTDKFITSTSLKGDWRIPQNKNLWQGVNGINNPCPTGWRLATQQEWTDEGFTSITDAFEKLKLTYSGARDVTSGNFSGTESGAWYWTATVDPTDDVYSVQVYLDASSIAMYGNNRGYGVPCRCIKD